jgi:hypothetical protein
MPLHVGDRGVQAENWRVVQLTFKAKPAFSVKKGSADFARPVLVFGVNDFTGIQRTNYEGCHYVHYSLSENGKHFSGVWEVGTYGDAYIHGTANVAGSEPSLKDAFYVALFSSANNLFEQAFRPDSTTSVLLDNICSMDQEIVGQLGTLQQFVQGFFMGCSDCNSRMTISEFVGPLFELIFSDSTYAPAPGRGRKKRGQVGEDRRGDGDDEDVADTPSGRAKKRSPAADGFTDEMMLHYVMLRGLLNAGDQCHDYSNARPEERYFKVGEKKRRDAWLLKCIMMWCSLQILFCSWKMAALFDGKRHHTNYIYRGVMDFYLSMWFFALYSVCIHDRQRNLYFDEFHYYYTSMMPFYFHQRAGFNGPFNLCTLVLTEQNIGQRVYPADDDDTISQVQQELEIIFNRVTAFWNNEMNAICLGIHAVVRGGGVPSQLPPFFTPFDAVEQFRNRALDDRTNLDAQSFCDALTPFWYWFHFRHITMGVISATSRDYLQTPNMPQPAKAEWYNWCRRFDTRVAQLGVRMLMQQKKELIRLRTLNSHNSNQSGTSLRRLDSRSPLSPPPPLPRFGADAVAPSSTSESRTA